MENMKINPINSGKKIPRKIAVVGINKRKTLDPQLTKPYTEKCRGQYGRQRHGSEFQCPCGGHDEGGTRRANRSTSWAFICSALQRGTN